jgi:hypothetical protein
MGGTIGSRRRAFGARQRGDERSGPVGRARCAGGRTRRRGPADGDSGPRNVAPTILWRTVGRRTRGGTQPARAPTEQGGTTPRLRSWRTPEEPRGGDCRWPPLRPARLGSTRRFFNMALSVSGGGGRAWDSFRRCGWGRLQASQARLARPRVFVPKGRHSNAFCERGQRDSALYSPRVRKPLREFSVRAFLPEICTGYPQHCPRLVHCLCGRTTSANPLARATRPVRARAKRAKLRANRWHRLNPQKPPGLRDPVV